jgi:hypothetical protein
MNKDSLFLWSLFNAVLPLIIPFLILWFILWVTDRSQIINNAVEAFSDGQLCVLAVTLSLITFYELRSIDDFALSTWSVILAVMSAILLGLIYALNDSERTVQNKKGQVSTFRPSKRKITGISFGAAVASVISAIYCHNAIEEVNVTKNEIKVMRPYNEQSRL